jgi:hypothetical protein
VPSDDVTTRTDGSSPYPYSYTMNWHLANNFTAAAIGAQTDLFMVNLTISRIRNGTDKIVFVEEDYRTLNDATWAPMGCPQSNNGWDWLASRHEQLRDKPRASSSPRRRGASRTRRPPAGGAGQRGVHRRARRVRLAALRPQPASTCYTAINDARCSPPRALADRFFG